MGVKHIGTPYAQTAAEEILVLRPHVRVQGEREGGGGLVVGVAGDAEAGLGFEGLVLARASDADVALVGIDCLFTQSLNGAVGKI